MTTPPESSASCLLCGAPSTLRCSNCALKAGIDLFFCSKEHQKLVWPFHRLVCGERAHPFRLPPFSQEEADVLLERLTKPPSSAKEADLQTQFLIILEDAQLSGPDLKSKVNQLVGQECAIACMHDAARSSRMEYRIRFIRKSSANWYWELRPRLPTPTVPRMPNLEGFVKAYDQFTADNAHPVATDTLWFSMFCHRLASHVPIVKQVEDAMAAHGCVPNSQQYLFKLEQESLASLLRYLDASSKHPDRARFCIVTSLRVEAAYRTVTAD